MNQLTDSQKPAQNVPLGTVLFLGYTNQQTSLISEIEQLGWHVIQEQGPLSNLQGYDAIISFGYRHILKPELLQTTDVPVVNLHISLLPFNRGAHPNFWSFYDNTPSGVTIHLINQGIDTSEILYQKEVSLKTNLTFRQTHKQLVDEIEKLFVDNIETILTGAYTPQPQSGRGSHHFMKDLPDQFAGWDSVIEEEIRRLKKLALPPTGLGEVTNGHDADQSRFSERIKSRHKRWWIDKQPHPYKQLGGKMQGRDFAVKMGCKVPELYLLTANIEDIPKFAKLPKRFVLKPTKGWSANNVFLMADGTNTLDGKAWSRQQVIEKISTDPVASQAGVKFLVEEYLVNWDGKFGAPNDYKFYMFGAEIAFIHVIERNSGVELTKNRHWFMDHDWQPIKKRIVSTQVPQQDSAPQPSCYEELMSVTKRLGEELNMFMRIDLYATDKGAVFGEFTPQPHGGRGYTDWADKWLGSLWHGIEGC